MVQEYRHKLIFTGLTIQRKSHVQDENQPFDLRRKPHRRPLWLLGFAIFISSNLFGTVFQIGALPIVILAPLGAVSLLWNALLAKVLLGDVFTSWMALGTAMVATGAVLIAVFGVVPEPNHSLDDLLHLLARPAFVVFASVLGVTVVGVLVHVSRMRNCCIAFYLQATS
jgi:drug/metabolite transporter (DMT)-like permease